MSVRADPLPTPARYFPITSGRYELKPGLSRFGKSFGNGPADGHVFQLDREFPRFRKAKLDARAERLDKYFQLSHCDEDVVKTIAEFIMTRLTLEHPACFSLESPGRLRCGLTGSVIEFDEQMRLGSVCNSAASPPCRHILDALACEIQEDLAILSADESRHWLSALHLCFANHWAAEDKIGRTFAEIHDPVAEIEPVVEQSEQLVRIMTGSTDGLVRFAWGISTDTELNRHPAGTPTGPPPRRFNPADPRAFVRVERQTLWGFPSVNASLFTIRTSFLDCATMPPDEKLQLISAIESMTESSLRYKGLVESKELLIRWLRDDSPQQTISGDL